MSEQLYRKVRKFKHPWQGVSVSALGQLNECEFEYVPIGDQQVKIVGNDGDVLFMTIKGGVRDLYIDDKLVNLSKL